jgi:SpoVK/Ycf46/Vps4 family AAA+-type ATPase
VILIDEAEKTFSEKDDAHILLKLIDGVYNRTRKLYILTTNKLHINENLLGRPGRIRYIQEFTNLPKTAVEEYLEDNLEDKSKKQAVMDIVDLLEISTIDILKSIVEEFNIFGDIGGERSIMNIPKCSYVFDAVYFHGYTDEDVENIRQIIKDNKPENVTMYEWFNKVKKGPLIKGTVEGSIEKSEEDNKNNGEEKDVTDLFTDGDDKYCYTIKITSRFQDLFKGSDCNEGTVMSEISEDGFLMIKDGYGNLELYMLLRQRKTNSLYKPFAF